MEGEKMKYLSINTTAHLTQISEWATAEMMIQSFHTDNVDIDNLKVYEIARVIKLKQQPSIVIETPSTQ